MRHMGRATAAAAMAIAALATLTACGKKASADACTAIYVGGRAPEAIPRPGHRIEEMRLIQLCNHTYAVLYSAVTRTTLASAEHLTAEDLAQARGRQRHDRFHADDRLPAGAGATLEDYRARSLCVDRGHMANNADAPTDSDADETFLLSNIVVQDTDNNQRLWLALERKVREDANRNGEAYVVSGPVFKGPGLLLNNRIYIPQFLYKAFYVPRSSEAGVYVTRNSAGLEMTTMSLDGFRAWAGIEPMPGAPPEVRRLVPPAPPIRNALASNRELKGTCQPIAIDGGPLPTESQGNAR